MVGERIQFLKICHILVWLFWKRDLIFREPDSLVTPLWQAQERVLFLALACVNESWYVNVSHAWQQRSPFYNRPENELSFSHQRVWMSHVVHISESRHTRQTHDNKVVACMYDMTQSTFVICTMTRASTWHESGTQIIAGARVDDKTDNI